MNTSYFDHLESRTLFCGSPTLDPDALPPTASALEAHPLRHATGSSSDATTRDADASDRVNRGAARPSRAFRATLTGAGEVPPRATDARGNARFTLQQRGRRLAFRVNVSDIENVVGAHLHLGRPGENGDIVVNLLTPRAPGGGPTDGRLVRGTITRADLTGPLEGRRFNALVRAIRNGNVYLNVHTDDGTAPANTGPGDFPDGEIRGQLTVRQNPNPNPNPDPGPDPDPGPVRPPRY